MLDQVLEVGQPTEVSESVEGRREDCGHYQACLLYAINKEWTNFSCCDLGLALRGFGIGPRAMARRELLVSTLAAFPSRPATPASCG